MSSIAQEESRSLSENVTWGHRKRFADGKLMVAYSRFLGYDKGLDGNLAVNPDEAKIVMLIFAEFLSGYSYRAIADKLTEMGIKTTTGKKKWRQNTIKSILTNEKYKGDALLQKSYTVDFLTKKHAVNHGEVPQYYVEDSHEAIIEPAIFDRVQDMVKEREGMKKYSGKTIFSSRIQCGCCGEMYGPKIWHSNDQYRRVIWQCNAKFQGRTRCKTPHLTEDQVKAAFVKVVNKLIKNQNEILSELKNIRNTLSGTEELEAEQQKLAEQMNVDAEAISTAVVENAWKIQNRDDYSARIDLLSDKARESRSQYEKVTAEIAMRGIRRQEFDRFIKTVEELPMVITEFDEALWCSLVDHITIYRKDKIIFTLNNGMEIKA